MMAEEFHVTLQGGAPWGFRLQGGKEFRSPLRIAKVEPTGKAGLADVKVGDHVTMINGSSTADLYHTEALSSVKRAGGTLELYLFRPEGDGLQSSTNGYAPQSRTLSSAPAKPRSVISSSGSLSGSINISPTSDSSRSFSGSSELLNGQRSVSEQNNRNTLSSSRSYDDYVDSNGRSGFPRDRDQWSTDVINAAVATPGQITLERDYTQRQVYSTSSSEDREDTTSSARSSTLPRRPPAVASKPPRRLDDNARARTMPRKSSSGNRAPEWYKQMYKEMHSSMEVGASHLGVLLASDAAKGAFRSYDGATSPGGNRSQSPDTGPGSDYYRSSEMPPQRRTSASTMEFRSNRSAATNPNRKSMPNINPSDIPSKPAPKAVKSSWYREMQRGGEIPTSGLSSTLPAGGGAKKVFLYNEETKEIKPAQGRVSRPPPVRDNKAPETYDYNNPPDFLDLRRREEATGVRQIDMEREQQLNEEDRRRQRERELKEQEQIELLRQQEEQEFELERQAEMERQRIDRERRRQEEERHALEEKRKDAERAAERAAEEERQRKLQEQRRMEEVERQEAKRLLEEQRQHEEQRRLNEKRRQEEERRKEDERRRQEDEQRQQNMRRKEEERQMEIQRRRQEEEDRQRELQRREEIQRKEEEERLQAEELKRIAAIESTIAGQDQRTDDGQLAKALYTFRPQSDSELTFRKGDIIKVLDQVDENWFEGELEGVIGIFPSNYVELLEPPKPEPQVEIQIEEGLAKAKYNFKAESPKELPFKKNDQIILLRRIDDNWYEGEVNDKIGIFPLAYVEVINEPRVIESGMESPRHDVNNQQKDRQIHQNDIITTTVEQVNYSAPEPQFDLDANFTPGQNGELDLPQGERHRAKFGYRPMNQDELELHEGDTVFVLEKCDDGWFVGTCERSGQFGTFPGNYVVPV